MLGVRHKSVSSYMSILLTDQPFDSSPGTACSFAGYSLNVSAPTYILGPKGNKPCLWEYFNMIVVPFATATWFLTDMAVILMWLGCHLILLVTWEVMYQAIHPQKLYIPED